MYFIYYKYKCVDFFFLNVSYNFVYLGEFFLIYKLYIYEWWPLGWASATPETVNGIKRPLTDNGWMDISCTSNDHYIYQMLICVWRLTIYLKLKNLQYMGVESSLTTESTDMTAWTRLRFQNFCSEGKRCFRFVLCSVMYACSHEPLLQLRGHVGHTLREWMWPWPAKICGGGAAWEWGASCRHGCGTPKSIHLLVHWQ